MISKNQLKYVRQLEMTKKFRQSEGLFVAEGPKVVGDLLKRYQPKAIFATSAWLSSHLSIPDSHLSIQEVTDDELRRLSLQQHPQQVLALFPLPASQMSAQTKDGCYRSDAGMINNKALSLALDDVQDPGNLGTIIRIADWFGITDIFCSQGTVDAWNPKVVQATMGSIARINISYVDLPEFIRQLPEGFPVYGTFLDGDNIYAQELTPDGLIVMGNEGNGISAEVRSLINRRLFIPDFHQGDTADSLNVAIATAITCSEFRRRY